MPSSATSKEQAMTDPHRIAEASGTPQAMQSRRDRGGIARPLLWLALLICAVGNGVTSMMNISVFIGIGFGLLTLSFGAALVVDHYRRRRR
jgi:hypothetical protein